MSVGSRTGPAVSAIQGGSVINCRISPSASKSAIAEVGAEVIRVRIAAPAVEGKANEELVRFFAKLLGAPKSSIQIVRGETGKTKRVAVLGLGPAEVLLKIRKGT